MQDRATVIAVRGAVQFEDAEEFRSLLGGHIAKGRELWLDLERCEFLCSMAIGTILGYKIESTRMGGDLWIVRASEPVKQLLELVGGTEAVLRPSAPEDAPAC